MEHRKPKDYNLYFYHKDIFNDSDTVKVFIEKKVQFLASNRILCHKKFWPQEIDIPLFYEGGITGGQWPPLHS